MKKKNKDSFDQPLELIRLLEHMLDVSHVTFFSLQNTLKGRDDNGLREAMRKLEVRLHIVYIAVHVILVTLQ